jgi:uncharacterized protein (TIGR03435 family)
MAQRVLCSVPLLVTLFAVPYGEAQSTPAPPAFDVASIKLNPKCEGGGLNGMSPGRLDLSCAPLRSLIRIAYGNVITGGTFASRRLEVLGGPEWLDKDRYDISAKVEGSASQEQILGPMLQALLEDRFKVKAHKEPRDTAVFALTVVKADRLQVSKEGSCVPMDLNRLPRAAAEQGGPMPRFCGGGGGRMGKGGLIVEDWYGVTMAEFAGRMLASEVDRPVVDQTGLTGRYDLHLEFVSDRRNGGPPRLNGAASTEPSASPADPGAPSILDALREQLGLKLSPARGPIEVIVVDHAERPSAN